MLFWDIFFGIFFETLFWDTYFRWVSTLPKVSPLGKCSCCLLPNLSYYFSTWVLGHFFLGYSLRHFFGTLILGYFWTLFPIWDSLLVNSPAYKAYLQHWCIFSLRITFFLVPFFIQSKSDFTSIFEISKFSHSLVSYIYI